MKIEVTEQEYQTIIAERERRALLERIKEKQTSCKHPKALSRGRFGHNGDEWYYCPDCRKEWSK